jgi:hypothetical protein
VGQVNRATIHATVSELWHVLSGHGELWRRDDTHEETAHLSAGVSVDIPVGTAFQYRCTGAYPLRFLCITMPPWPGDDEATLSERVLKEEHKLLPRAVRLVLEGRVRLDRDRVVLDGVGPNQLSLLAS